MLVSSAFSFGLFRRERIFAFLCPPLSTWGVLLGEREMMYGERCRAGFYLVAVVPQPKACSSFVVSESSWGFGT